MATPTKPQPGAFLLSLRNNIGLVCGFAATDSGLYYNRVYHRHKFRLYIEFTTGRPATAVRSSNRPALLVGQHLTGWKGLAVPYEGPGKGHFFTIRAEGYASRRYWFAFVAAGRRIRRGRPRGRPATRGGFPEASLSV